MDLKTLEYIVAIHEEGSISKAARKCYISQPTMSVCLKKLEEEIGMPLFERKGSQTVATKAGIQYVETAKKILSLKKELYEHLSSQIPAKTGFLRLGLFQNIGSAMIAAVYPQFKALFPRIRLDVSDARYPTLYQGLMEESLDLAVIAIVDRDPSLEYRTLKKEPFLLVRSPLLTSVKEVCPFILAPEGTVRRQVENLFFAREGWHPESYDEVHNVHTTLDMVRKGLGMALVPSGFVCESEDLQVVSVRQSPYWTLVGATKKGRVPDSSLKKLLQLIQTYYRQNFPY